MDKYLINALEELQAIAYKEGNNLSPQGYEKLERLIKLYKDKKPPSLHKVITKELNQLIHYLHINRDQNLHLTIAKYNKWFSITNFYTVRARRQFEEQLERATWREEVSIGRLNKLAIIIHIGKQRF